MKKKLQTPDVRMGLPLTAIRASPGGPERASTPPPSGQNAHHYSRVNKGTPLGMPVSNVEAMLLAG